MDPTRTFLARPFKIPRRCWFRRSVSMIFKRVLQQRGETEALRAVAFMQAGEVLDLSSSIAMHAARISLDLKIPMADSMMLASAREFGATLLTQDSDFEGLEDVAYIRAQ